MGGLVAIFVTRGDVDRLVIIYSFSVFVTFLLSQMGMVRYWFTRAGMGARIRGAVSVVAALLSATILASLFVASGATYAIYALAAIGVLALLCVLVRSHYGNVSKNLGRLQTVIQAAEADPYSRSRSEWNPSAPTAVFLVSGYNGPGLHTVMEVKGIFPDCFRQAVIVSVGQLDFDRFKGQHEVENLKASIEADAKKYVTLLERWGI